MSSCGVWRLLKPRFLNASHKTCSRRKRSKLTRHVIGAVVKHAAVCSNNDFLTCFGRERHAKWYMLTRDPPLQNATIADNSWKIAHASTNHARSVHYSKPTKSASYLNETWTLQFWAEKMAFANRTIFKNTMWPVTDIACIVLLKGKGPCVIVMPRGLQFTCLFI